MKIRFVQLESHTFLTDLDFAELYAKRHQNARMIGIHRAISNAPAAMLCDPKNHNTMDNRKSNLRACTPAQNSYNRLPETGGASRYKDVHWHKDSRKWRQQASRHSLTSK